MAPMRPAAPNTPTRIGSARVTGRHRTGRIVPDRLRHRVGADHRKRTSQPGRACAQPSMSPSLDDGDHGVAAGGRVVGQEDERLAVGRHLDRPQHQALAGSSRGHGPREGRTLEPQGDPVGSRLDTRYGG